MEKAFEFFTSFDDNNNNDNNNNNNEEEYIVTLIISNPLLLTIIIEHESKGIYWKKQVNEQLIKEITTQMGNFITLERYLEMLIKGLNSNNKSNNNSNNKSNNSNDELIKLKFCSLKEIQELANNQLKSKNNKTIESYTEDTSNLNKSNTSTNPLNNIKKYLMLMVTSNDISKQTNKIIYPLQMDYLSTNPEIELLNRTNKRLRKRIENLKAFNLDLQKENKNLQIKTQFLEEQRMPGAVQSDDFYKNFTELSEEYQKYKEESANKIKILSNKLEELKLTKTKELEINTKEKEKRKSKILDLEKKLEIASDMLVNERKKEQKLLNERNKQQDELRKEIKNLNEIIKNYKVKVSNLEKELIRERKEANYYRCIKTNNNNYNFNNKKNYKSSNNSYRTNSKSYKANSYKTNSYKTNSYKTSSYKSNSYKSYKSAGSYYTKTISNSSSRYRSNNNTINSSGSFLKKNLIPGYLRNYKYGINYAYKSPYGVKQRNYKKKSSIKNKVHNIIGKSIGYNSIKNSYCSKKPNKIDGYMKKYVSPYKAGNKNNLVKNKNSSARSGNSGNKNIKNNNKSYQFSNQSKKNICNNNQNNTIVTSGKRTNFNLIINKNNNTINYINKDKQNVNNNILNTNTTIKNNNIISNTNNLLNNSNQNRINDLNTINIQKELGNNSNENIVDRLTKIQNLLNKVNRTDNKM